MRIGIAVKPGLADARETLAGVEQWLQANAVDAVWTEEAADLLPPAARSVVTRATLPADLTLLLVLGGDGTLLAMAKAVAEAGLDIPLLAVNFGSLGFLTEITRPEIYTSLEAVIAGRASHDERMMLQAVATCSGTTTTYLALNDVVFTRTALSRMIDLEVSVGDQFVTSVKADGLIVASPTGSTAYNLAAGGPIVHPAMDALVLTPIAPHSLTNRPIVIPSEREVRVTSTGTNAGNVYVTIDGQTGFEMEQGDQVAISRAARPLRLVRASARSYFEVLRQKLKWNER
jgi:NAD+ kinase